MWFWFYQGYPIQQIYPKNKPAENLRPQPTNKQIFGWKKLGWIGLFQGDSQSGDALIMWSSLKSWKNTGIDTFLQVVHNGIAFPGWVKVLVVSDGVGGFGSIELRWWEMILCPVSLYMFILHLNISATWRLMLLIKLSYKPGGSLWISWFDPTCKDPWD